MWGCTQVRKRMAAWAVSGCIAVVAAGAPVETGLKRGEGEKDGGAPRLVLSNLRWLTLQAVHQPNRASGYC